MSQRQTSPTETARYAVLGSPIAHSLSPSMQQAAFAAANIAATYEALEVVPDTLGPVVEKLRAGGYAGWNVTTPLKEAMLAHLDAFSYEARDIGAVNVVRREPDGRLTGHNTDGSGFVRAIAELWNWRPADARVLILGSGPAARAVAYALRQVGVPQVFCWSRNSTKAAAIAPLPDQAANLIVSTLPSDAHVPTTIAQWVTVESDVMDLNYAVDHSAIESLPARRRSDGLPLLLHQGALSFEWWTGQRAPLAAMRAAIRR